MKNNTMFRLRFIVTNRKKKIIFTAWMNTKRTEVQWTDENNFVHKRIISTRTAKSLINDGVWELQ